MNSEFDRNWYFGKLDRATAVEILKEGTYTYIHTQLQFHHMQRTDIIRFSSSEGRQNGTFLVRESATSARDFVLSVLYNDEVAHFQIRRCTIDDAFFSIGMSSLKHILLNKYYIYFKMKISRYMVLIV